GLDRFGELRDLRFVVLDGLREPADRAVALFQPLVRVRGRGRSAVAVPRERLAELRDLALQRVVRGLVMVRDGLEAHRFRLAATELRELALLLVDVGLKPPDDLGFRRELRLEPLDLL